MAAVIKNVASGKNVHLINREGEFSDVRVNAANGESSNISFSTSLIRIGGGFISSDKKRITYLTAGGANDTDFSFIFPTPEKELEIKYCADTGEESSEIARLVRSVGICFDDNGACEITIDSAETQSDINAQNKELDKKIAQVTAQSKLTKASVEAKKKYYENLVAASEDYRNELLRLDANIKKENAAIKESNAAVKSIREEYEKLCRERERIDTVKEALEADCSKAKAEIDAVRARLGDDNVSVEMMDELFRLKTPLKKKLEDVKKAIDDAEKQIARYIAVQELISKETHKAIAESDGNGFISARKEAGGN